MLRVRRPRTLGRGAVFGVLCAAAVLMWSGAAPADRADTHVFLLRGWFGVFSTGLDTLAEDLRTKGIKAETADHLAWRSILSKVIKDRAAGNSGPLVLIGHSQGGNNVIDIARVLEREKIRVDLLVTLAPFGQDPVPGNVARAINYKETDSPPQLDSDDAAMAYERFIRCGSAKAGGELLPFAGVGCAAHDRRRLSRQAFKYQSRRRSRPFSCRHR